MRKLLTIMLALVMSLSITMLFVACEDEVVPQDPAHVHTYATEWTSDATHHWRKATCEHTEEISDKAEHSYGENGKCTVCQKEKPATSDDSAYKVTAEQWTTKFNALSNMSNVRIVDLITHNGDNMSSSVVEIDGDKTSYFMYNGNVFEKTGVIVKIDENTYDVYEKTTEDGQYTKLQNNPDYLVEDILEGRIEYMYKVAAIFAKDYFSSAVYSQANENYTLTVSSAEFPLISVSNLEYTVSFENGEIKELSINYDAVIQGNSYNYNFDFEFGGVEITVPTDYVLEPATSVLTEEQWEQSFTFSQPFGAGWTLSGVVSGYTITQTIQIDVDKVRYVYTETSTGSDVYEETICVKDGDSGMIYERDGEFFMTIQDEALGAFLQYNETFDAYFSVAEALRDKFASATPSGEGGVYNVVIDSLALMGRTATNLRYTVTFEESVLVDVECKFDFGGVDNTINFDFTGITINVPTPDQILPSQN